jgi:hypothetical protein
MIVNPVPHTYALSRVAPRLVMALEWIDRWIFRCRWRWFCHWIQFPAWLIAQRELDLQQGEFSE